MLVQSNAKKWRTPDLEG